MTSAAGKQTVFIDSNQMVYIFGVNGGYFGKNNELFKTPILISNNKWKKISIGDSFLAGIQEDDTLWVIGYNYYGQLGANSNAGTVTTWTQIGTDRKWKDVSCGERHMIAIDEYGEIWGAGSGHTASLTSQQAGLLGNENTAGIIELTRLSNITLKVKKVYCANNRNYLIGEDNNLYAFGLAASYSTSQYTLPFSHYYNPMYLTRHILDMNSEGKGEVISSTNWRKYLLQPVRQAMNVQKVEAGERFAYMLGIDNKLYYQGNNSYGEINIDFTDGIIKLDSTRKWKDFSCGYYHVVAIAEDGTLWSRGYNGMGQLGDGTTNNRNVWVKISDEQWSNVYCGMYHTVAIKEDGTIWTFGQGINYTLGNGATSNQPTPINVTPTNVDVYKCAENIVTKKYVVNQKAVFKFTVDAIPKLYSIIPKGDFPVTSGFLMQFSDDNATWKTFDSVAGEWKVAASNDEGITVSEISSIVDEDLAWLSDKEFYINVIMWTTSEDSSVILNGFDAKLYMNLNAPQVASLNVSAMKAEIDKADFSATRATSSNPVYAEVKEDEVTDLTSSSEGQYLKVKADLQKGQTIDALSYSHN